MADDVLSPRSRDGSARCPGPSTSDIIAADARPAPPILAEGDVDFLGDGDLDVAAYISPDVHRRELASMWSRCWQMACREEVLREPGDMIVYDIGDNSAIVLRDPAGQLRAFVNSCPHRGTRLIDQDGHQAHIRCIFHGLTWRLDGSVQTFPCAWDFPAGTEARMALQSLPVGCWNGFVFVTFDPDAPSLESYLEDLPAHFARWPLDRRFTAAHVAKRFACNWKIALEAFLETYHVIGLHPESLPFLGDANSQYDVWEGRRHYSRMINPSGVPSPHLPSSGTPQRVVNAAAKFGLCTPGPLAEGETPRSRIADSLRGTIRERLGVDLSDFGDSEVLDVIEYYLFPNLMLFGGFGSPLAYRSRPMDDDPNQCLFEVWLLLPYAGNAPPAPAPMRMLRDDEAFADVPELSYFGAILDQDAVAMPRVQRGLRASRKRTVTPGRYQELRIRHMRQTLAEYLAD